MRHNSKRSGRARNLGIHIRTATLSRYITALRASAGTWGIVGTSIPLKSKPNKQAGQVGPSQTHASRTERLSLRIPDAEETTKSRTTSFLKRLLEDAQPNADTVKRAANRVIASHAVQTCGRLGYNGLVRTVGVGLVLAEPAGRITKKFATAVWKAIEKAADNK